MHTYSSYTGYIYIWYDIKAKLFYVGGHYGKVEDSYICSNKPMKRAYKLRPHTFKFKVIQFVSGDVAILRQAEQRWLDMIGDHELMISDNVKNGTCRYYNVKKTANGGSHKGHKKNRTKPAWNKGYNNEEMRLRKQGLLCFIGDKPKTPIHQKRTVPDRNKRQRKSKQPSIFICNACGCEFTSINNRITCSLSCAGKMPWIKGTAVSGFKKNQVAWNKGFPNTTSAENGKKSAVKLSARVKGRKLVMQEDGTRHWIYPNQGGEII